MNKAPWLKDFGTSNFLQFILARALAEGVYDRHLPVIAAAYRRKRDAMVEAIRSAFPNTVDVGQASRLSTACKWTGETPVLRFNKPRGGMYVWVQLDPRMKTGMKSALFKRALKAGVLYVPGDLCFCVDPTRPVPRNCIRLSFGSPTVQQIQKGIRLLANALD